MNKIWAMAKEHKIITTLLMIVFLYICWHQYNHISATWRYKTTITVETPEGIKTGFAVCELSNSDDRYRLMEFPDANNMAGLTCESVVVDLGKRGVLFTLVPEDLWFYNIFPAPYGGETRYEGIEYYKHLKNAKALLKLSQYPNFVTFTDINDPKTVKSVDYNDLSATFGAGVKLKDITVETTDEPLTNEIDKYLTKEFWIKFDKWWNFINNQEKMEKASLFNFRKGAK